MRHERTEPVKHERWTCDRCDKDLPGEPNTFAAFGGQSPIQGDENFWTVARVHLCQACMDLAVTFLVGPSLRKALETPEQLNVYTRYEPEVPWRVKIGFRGQ